MSEGALKVAAGEVILSVRQKIQHLIQQILVYDTGKEFSPKIVAQMLLSLVSRWDWEKADHGELEILLSKNELISVQELFIQTNKR